MELHQLRYFVRIAERQSFTRAAEELGVAQPSLSQQLRKLERELGFALCERGPGGVRLTSEGVQFLPYARAVLDRLEEATTAASEIRGLQRGQVAVGVSPIAGAHLLPRLVRAVAERFPGLTIRAREEGLSRLLELLERGEIDLATVLMPVSDANLVCATVLAEDIVLVLPAAHRLARSNGAGEPVELRDLSDESFVLLTPEFGLRQRVADECAQAGFSPAVRFESREVGIIQGLVEAELGITLLPEGAVRRDLATVIRPVVSRGRRPQRQIGLAMRGDRYVPLAARRVFELARGLYRGTPSFDSRSVG